jgi:anthranilate phosphoribosyltransferase
MFAPLYHGATARVAGIRRQLGVQTTFNLLGPLTNPAGAPRQIIGVSNRDVVEPIARALTMLGTERAWVVHGEDGLDEITLAAATLVSEVSDEGVQSFEISPEDFGLSRGALENVRGGDAGGNARIIRDVLNGQRRDEARALVILNAAAALHVGGASEDLRTGVRLAEQSIDSGQASQKLDELVKLTK